MSEVPPPAPTMEEEAAKPAFQFNFGAPPAGGTTTMSTLMTQMKIVDGVKVSDDSDEDEDSDNDEVPSDEEDDDLEGIALSPHEALRVAKLRELSDKAAEITEEYMKERVALEKKFQAMRTPLYEERARIVKGEQEVTLDEIGITANDLVLPANASKGIQRFWFTAMANLEPFQQVIDENDIDALSYLHDISCEDNDDISGFTLSFHFAENPYFTNSVLTKTYKVSGLLKDDQEPTLESLTGCKIDWKKDKCLTHTVKKKKQRSKKGKNAGQVRYVTENTKNESFFHFFSPPDLEKLKSMKEDDDLPEDSLEELYESIHEDYELGATTRLTLIPSAVLCYTGELMEDGDEEEDDDEEEEEDSDEEPPVLVQRGKKGARR